MDAYKVLYWLLGIPVRALFWVRVEGKENIPKSGGVIFAANHTSFWDSVILIAVLPLRLRTRFLSKQEHYSGTSARGKFKAWLAGIFALPVQREGDDRGKNNLATIQASDEYLRSGYGVGNHIEGSRTPAGYMFAGQRGAVRQARRTGAVIVPTVILGARDGRPFGRVRVRFAAPVVLHDYAHEDTYTDLRRGEDLDDTRSIAEAIAMLGNLRYTGCLLTPVRAKLMREETHFCSLVYGRADVS